MSTLTTLDDAAILQSGENVAVQFSATNWGLVVWPSAADVVLYTSSDSRYSPTKFEQSVLANIKSGFGGTIYFTITDAGDGMLVSDLIQGVMSQLNYFKMLTGISISEVDSVTPSLFGTPSLTSTIWIAAIAIILVVGLVLYFQVKRTVIL